MIQGKIIKFYRELQGLRQADLGNQICSSTHISKIERGITEVSEETIKLLAKKLDINMHDEIETYYKLNSVLKEWHEAIILKLNSKATSMKAKLEGISLLKIQDFYRFYTLVLTRYYLLIGEKNLAKALIEEMNCWQELSPYDQNMLYHIKGKFYLDYQGEYKRAISYLKRIDLTYYNNPEYYFDLAVAYMCMNSHVLAYHYANKALQFFTNENSFNRILETEMLMLIQVEQEEIFDTKDSGYPRLIEMAESLGLNDQKAKLLHNYAYQQFRNGSYKQAFDYYSQSLKLRDKSHPHYLVTLEGYLNTASKLGLQSNIDLIKTAKKGLALANKSNDAMYLHYFQLHVFKIQNLIEEYYQYLETVAYPFFKEKGYGLATENYEIKLFDYYLKRGDIERANQFTHSIVDRYRKNSELV
ncbi:MULTISPECIES: helix-turn-helix domain-containing protein [unclassified Bacillus (in: firmicutes)]|uniref:helix-turn-helix domain-containing protein n=1 Tax=unclassified Bacillus (in: firmicutes) TaxID=185979 RepID=UPI000BF24C5B|nr:MULTISPECIES: helix-turn-helix domain-containing protein [unclassified Bacillus (in: firmicutes)]PEJ60880.1 transcriptional regulator [Bacillus sp. AFS002410]